MRNVAPISLFAVLALGACTASDATLGSGDQDLFIGTRSSTASGNGLPFAVPASVVEDLEAAGPIKVKVARALTDYSSGSTRLVISTETLTMSPGDIAGDLGDITLTLGGETITFTGGTAPTSNGQPDWESYVNTLGDVSGTGAIYSYADGPLPGVSGEFDTEAFFVFGYETDPDEIVALMGTAIYAGSFSGYGQVISPSSGDVVEGEEPFFGTLVLTADFNNDVIGGNLAGTFGYDYDTSNAVLDTVDFTTEFTGAPIEGNGFVSDLGSMTCDSATCTSDAQIGGAFFGTDADEVSGLIGVDVTVDPDAGDAFRYIAGGGFTAE